MDSKEHKITALMVMMIVLSGCGTPPKKEFKTPASNELKPVTLASMPPEKRTLIRYKVQPAIARNTALTLNELQTDTVMHDASLVGHRVRDVPSVNLFSYLGITPGDILVSANGARIQSPKELVLFIRDLDAKGRGELTFIRTQHLWTYRYSIKN